MQKHLALSFIWFIFLFLNDCFHQDTGKAQLWYLSLCQEQVRNEKPWKHSHGWCYLIYSRASRDTPPIYVPHLMGFSRLLRTRTAAILFIMGLQRFREAASCLGLYCLRNNPSFFFNHIIKHILFMIHVFRCLWAPGLKMDVLLGSTYLVTAFLQRMVQVEYRKRCSWQRTQCEDVDVSLSEAYSLRRTQGGSYTARVVWKSPANNNF